MAKHDRLPPVQLIHQRSECGVAEIFALVAGKHARAVRLERIEGVFEFEKGTFDIRERQRGEQAEAARIILNHFCRVFVALSRQGARGGVIAEPNARVADRNDRRGHAAFIHFID